MAKSRTKKTAPKRPNVQVVTKSYFDQYTHVVRKLLQLFSFDPDLFDELSKKQKLEMMEVRTLPPRIAVEPNHFVPRQYIDFLKKEVSGFLKSTLEDDNVELTYDELLTIGISFLTQISSLANRQGDNASEFVQKLSHLVKQLEQENALLTAILRLVQSHLIDISKINIRIYGLRWRYDIVNPKTVAVFIYITSTNPEVVSFTYRNKTRPAYRLAFGDIMRKAPLWFSIPHNAVIPESNDSRMLKIYVQNHALLRIKERLDTLAPFTRNSALTVSLTQHKMVKAKNGQMLFSFFDLNNQLLGYMPFTIEGDHLFVLSFIPLVNQLTPEGDKLYKALNLSKEDMKFLGMDKLSFYQYTDFKVLPTLKNALIEAGIWHLTEIKTEELIQGRPLIKSAGLAARYFQQTTAQPNVEEVLIEIAERYS